MKWERGWLSFYAERADQGHRGPAQARADRYAWVGEARGLPQRQWGLQRAYKAHKRVAERDEKHDEDVLLESLRQNFPQLRSFDSQVLFLDCRDMHDPGKDKSIRDHLGTYPPNISDMVLNPRKSQKWLAFAKEVLPAVPESTACAGRRRGKESCIQPT